MEINKVSRENKIIVSIVIIMILISTLKIKAYARKELDVPLPENKGYWVLIEITTKSGIDEGDKQYYYYTSENKMLYNPTTKKLEGEGIKLYQLLTADTEWIFISEVEEVGNLYNETEEYIYEIVRSNYTIYYIDEETVFFSILSSTLNQHPPLYLMSPQIRGISPFLIGSLVVLVGFWKGFQFLYKTLQTG